MKIERLVVGQLQANCYLVWEDSSGRGLIIDPGDAGEYIIRKITDHGFTPEAILLTHGHFDHLLAVTELKLAYDIPVYLSAKDKFLFSRTEKTAKHFVNIQPDPILLIDHYLTDKEQIKFGAETLQVMETPGHTPGSVCFVGDKIVFSGDTLFKDGMGRTDFKYASSIEMEKSLKKIFKLPLDTVIYPGHGETTTVKEEKNSSTFRI